MQIREENRDLELENLIGNLLIAQYQVERLKDRVSENLVCTFKRAKTTEAIYKHKGEWYKISISVNQIDLEEK